MTADPGVETFDPFELPDTLQLSAVSDPYPYLAAARRQGPVQLEWPLPADAVAVEGGEREADEPWFNVLGYDEVIEVLRDHDDVLVDGARGADGTRARRRHDRDGRTGASCAPRPDRACVPPEAARALAR